MSESASDSNDYCPDRCDQCGIHEYHYTNGVKKKFSYPEVESYMETPSVKDILRGGGQDAVEQIETFLDTGKDSEDPRNKNPHVVYLVNTWFLFLYDHENNIREARIQPIWDFSSTPISKLLHHIEERERSLRIMLWISAELYNRTTIPSRRDYYQSILLLLLTEITVHHEIRLECANKRTRSRANYLARSIDANIRLLGSVPSHYFHVAYTQEYMLFMMRDQDGVEQTLHYPILPLQP